ncbi:hypothetical protein [Bacillus xiapuensis]|uniref:Transposase n=1 Tax=Bacillus xiapuensis TaxID=2014075 RepID=A0ABU6N833_9BACI|nr:hypothetical protein [Bacillus xiapuensis]
MEFGGLFIFVHPQRIFDSLINYLDSLIYRFNSLINYHCPPQNWIRKRKYQESRHNLIKTNIRSHIIGLFLVFCGKMVVWIMEKRIYSATSGPRHLFKAEK